MKAFVNMMFLFISSHVFSMEAKNEDFLSQANFIPWRAIDPDEEHQITEEEFAQLLESTPSTHLPYADAQVCLNKSIDLVMERRVPNRARVPNYEHPIFEIPNPSSLIQAWANAELWDVLKTGEIEKIPAILEGKADVNAKNEDNLTPLMWARKSGHRELELLLIAHGADARLMDQNNESH